MNALQARQGSRRNYFYLSRSVNSSDYGLYYSMLGDLKDERTARSSAAVVRVPDPDLPHGFDLVEYASVVQWLANLGNTPIVPSVAATGLVDTSMEDVPNEVTAANIVALDLATLHALLERSGVPPEIVTNMEKAVD